MLAVQMLTTAGSSPRPVQAAARTVGVHPGWFIGEPVTVARRQLRRLGLAVRVRWLRTSQQPARTVLSVWPGGQDPAGSLVTVTGALPPRPPGGQHHGQGGGNGNGADAAGDADDNGGG